MEKTSKTSKLAKKLDKPVDKATALANALKGIKKDFGEGAIMRLGEAAKNMNVEVIPTGILPLDIALGVDGLPRGRIIELYGPESSGKTTVALHMIAEAQKHDGVAAFIDAEHALDPAYAKRLGVDTDALLISQPDNGEQALAIVEALVCSGAVDMIVVDSVAALVPKSELEGEMTDQQVGMHARLMSKAMRKLTGYISKMRTVAVFINQVREKVGTSYGNPEVTTGGRALKFYSTIRIEVRKGETLKQGTEPVGARTKIKIAKNKVAPPFRTTEFDIMYGEGVSREGSVIDLAVDLDIMDKSGSWYSYNKSRLGQGKETVKALLKENKEMFKELEEKIKVKLAEKRAEEAKKAAEEGGDLVAEKDDANEQPADD